MADEAKKIIVTGASGGIGRAIAVEAAKAGYYVICHYNHGKEKAEETIIRMDKRRANYYNYHANNKWGKVTNYHLSLQNDFKGIDKTVELIKSFISVLE